MQREDIIRFDNHFRKWVATAERLELVDLIRDSNALVTELTTIHATWGNHDPPLPPLIRQLYQITSQIPPPPQAILIASYFQQVIAAVDDGHPIPPIPRYAYPNLRPVPDIPQIASIPAGKRKATSARQEIEQDARGKKQRTEDAVESDGTEESDEEGEDEGEGEKDELVNEGAGEQSEAQGTVMPKGKQRATTADISDDGMDVDYHLDESYIDPSATRQQTLPAPVPSVHRPVVEIKMKPGKAKKTRSKAPKSRPMIMDESDDEPAHLHTMPEKSTTSSTPPIVTTNGLSDAQLELSWRAQTKNVDLGKKVPTLSSIQCNNCQRDRILCWTATGSTACLNCRYVKKGHCQNVGPSTKKKDDIKKEGAQRTSGKKPAAKSKRSEEAASSSKLKITVPRSAVLQPPPSTSVTSAAVPLPATAPLRPLTASRSEDPMTSKPDTITVSKKRSRSASRAATTKAPMAHPHNAPAPVAASATAIEPAAPAPSPATVTDPLICSPLTQEEPRYIPALYGTAHHTVASKTPTLQDIPVSEIFARIGVLEAEVRRLGQENSRLQETILSRTEDVASRKEVSKLTKEIYRTSGRVGDLVTRVNTIDRFSNSSFTGSSATPSDVVNNWAFTTSAPTHDMFGHPNSQPQVDTRDRQQYPPVSGNVGIETDTMAQPSANTHANPHSQFSQPNHDGTIDPARLVLGHNTQQMAE